jgi:undecaprenyl diphosphate synthase
MIKIGKKEESQPFKLKVEAKHVAITTNGILKWALENKKSLEDAYKQSNLILKNTIKTQIKNKIPILTIYLLPTGLDNLEHFSIRVDSMLNLFNDLLESELIQSNKVKISAFGKWYDLPGRVVDPIKKLLDHTKDFDQFFVNFCINYNGQEEIVDACKILSMQIKTEKIELDSITQENIKSNIYTSDFLPPNLIIKNGTRQRINGLLLWDSARSSIIFTKKLWPDFGKDDFEKAINDYEKEKI